MTRQKILITGASSGLGAGMARAFAAMGRDLALCARRVDRLDELKAELTQRYPDITVAVRLDDGNQGALDYYLLPRLDFGQPRIHLADHNGIEFECYHFDSLDYLYGMARRIRIRRAA